MRSRVTLALGVSAALGTFGCGGCGSEGGALGDDGGVIGIADGAGDREAPSTACTEELLAGGCSAGHCRLSASRGTLSAEQTIVLAEKEVPLALAGDAIGDVMCEVTLPPGGALNHELDLSIQPDGPGDPAAVLFRYLAQGGSALVATSSAQGTGAAGTIHGSGTYGVTRRSGVWSIEGYAGQDVQTSTDATSVLRNVSSRAMASAFWDGTRLYVGNGARLLVYDGLPASPGTSPAVVLGQASLDAQSATPSSSTFRGGVGGVWSDGTKLAVATGSRVLVWSTVPKTTFAPADIVLGQPDFSSDQSNGGGVSASSLSLPFQIDSDGTRLAVADALNNRVLVWSGFPATLGQAASSVIGQASFTSAEVSAGAAPIYQAWGVAFAGAGAWVTSGFSGVLHVPSATAMNAPSDFSATLNAGRLGADVTYTTGALASLAGGGLAVRDWAARRVGVFRRAPSATGSYDFVLGQPDLARQVDNPVNASGSNTTAFGLSGTGSRLLVPDGNRVLVFDAPSYNYEPATFVVGQAGFVTNGAVDYRGTSASTLAGPSDVAVFGTKVAVADRANNRVLIYDRADLPAKPAAAKVVVGQPDAGAYVANGDLGSPTAARLSGPSGVALDADRLIVADTENHRVLVFSPVPTANGASASVVLGQADFTGRRPNHGRGDVTPLDGFSDADADGMFYPTGVATDGTHLVVADRLNHRVLVWSTIPTANDAPADLVLGQASFTANVANGGGGPFVPAADGLDLPSGVAIAGTSVYVADTENNRVVRFAGAFSAPFADAWIGQPDGATVTNQEYAPLTSPNVGLAAPIGSATAAGSVLAPRGVAIAGGVLYVSERSSNRVHMLDAATLQHVGVLGHPDARTATANEGGVGSRSLAAPEGIAADGAMLFVADAANHRVLGYDAAAPIATGAAATVFMGQPSELSSGFNQASTASGGASAKPRGLARFGGELYVADTGHHRVLVLAAPPKEGALPTRVLGQPDGNLVLPNAGGVPSARSLASPRGVFADAQRVVVADTGNHRVLVFDKTRPEATLVLGQSGFEGASANGGGAPSMATLSAPEGVYSDGTRLFVADTGNSRVLVWSTFPTQSGAAADVVLGQADGAGNLSNRGSGAAGADTLSAPTSIDVAGGALFVADSGNNRVVRFAQVPAVSGARADAALGQPDLASRGSASNPADPSRLAGPVALADDGANLYVVDRDLRRVVVFALPADRTGLAATGVLGAVGGLVVDGPAGIAVERTPFFTSRLYLSDTNGDRLVTVGSVSRLLSE